MGVVDELISGREAYDRRDWADAYDRLAAVDTSERLDTEDLSRWATAAYLLGRTSDCVAVLQRAYDGYRGDGDVPAAIRCTFWLGLVFMLDDQPAVGGGWFGRGWRLLEESGSDLAERGYLLVPRMFGQAGGGDFAGAAESSAEIEAIGRRLGSAELVTLGLHFRGRGLLHLDRVPEGLALMDEAMVGVAAGEVTPILAGMVYCSMIEACQEVSDVARARQWTSVLTRWCQEQTALVPFTGQCAVHRGQIMGLHGAFRPAIEELRRAGVRYELAGARVATGLASYERGEVHRILGEHTDAEAAYQQASMAGFEPQPGLALLRLEQGRADVATAMVHRLIAETLGVVPRSRILPAAVEVLIRIGDVAAARAAADELGGVAARWRVLPVEARSAFASGCVLLADGEAAAALPPLRRAWRIWDELGAPYEAARARARVARAYQALGDEDSARMELDAAARVFADLGASGELRELGALNSRAPCGLTSREVEVLRLVATGMGNAAIATELFLSEKTVARHLSNIFTKIGVGTRTAAAAFAFAHDLA